MSPGLLVSHYRGTGHLVGQVCVGQQRVQQLKVHQGVVIYFRDVLRQTVTLGDSNIVVVEFRIIQQGTKVGI